MVVVAEGRPRLAPECDVRAFAAEAAEAAETYSAAWQPIRIVQDGRHFIVEDTAQSIGSFKLRGATVAVAELRDRGVEHVTLASSGSFGMACATAAAVFGLRAAVFMPSNAPAAKSRAIEALGARVDASWPTYEDAKEAARRAGEEPGASFLDGVGPSVFRGNASVIREVVASGLLERAGAAIVVPLGIGSLAVPTALYLAGAGYSFDLVLVEPMTHSKYASALGASVAPSETETLADGAAVNAVPPVSLAILDRMSTAAVAVSESEIASAIRHLWREHAIRAEGAGALATAAALSAPELFARYTQIWTFVTGRNIDDRRFEEIVG